MNHQKARKTLPQQSTSKSTSVHPCFHCGLIFAKKDEFTQHVERFHQSTGQQKASDRFRCHECTQSFQNDEKAYKEHLLHHDLARILSALRQGEMARKRAAPIIVHAPFVGASSTSAVTSRTEPSGSPLESEDKLLPASTDGPRLMSHVLSALKSKGRPRSKSVFTSIKDPIVSPMSVLQQSSLSQLSESPKKRRRISNEPSPSPSQQTNATVPSSPQIAAVDCGKPAYNPAVGSPELDSDQADEEPKSIQARSILISSSSSVPQPDEKGTKFTFGSGTTSSFAATQRNLKPTEIRAGVSSSQIGSSTKLQQLLSTARSLPPLPSQASVQKMLAAVQAQSSCPNCDQNLGKPWHLVDHMIQRHDAQLLRLHKTLKKPEHGVAGGTMTTQTFNDCLCPFCRMEHVDLPACLLHVIRNHRSRLFECPENWECILTCDLMCAIGQDATSKKFTINVKVKRKPS